VTRKYNRSIGESHSFDAAGFLRDRKLATFTDARAMILKLQDAVPELGEDFITLRWPGRVTQRTFGTCNWRKRQVTLYPMGQQEKTMIHELAHIAAPGDRHGNKFKLMAAKLERVWRSMIGCPESARAAEQVVSKPAPVTNQPVPFIVTQYLQLRREGKLQDAVQLFNNATTKMQALMLQEA